MSLELLLLRWCNQMADLHQCCKTLWFLLWALSLKQWILLIRDQRNFFFHKNIWDLLQHPGFPKEKSTKKTSNKLLSHWIETLEWNSGVEDILYHVGFDTRLRGNRTFSCEYKQGSRKKEEGGVTPGDTSEISNWVSWRFYDQPWRDHWVAYSIWRPRKGPEQPWLPVAGNLGMHVLGK